MYILDKNTYGKIIKCNCCNEIQFQLGNTVIVFTPNEFYEFDQFFDEIRNDFPYLNCDNKYKRQFLIRTNKKKSTIFLSYNELEAAISLINNAVLMLSISDIMQIK